MPVSYRIDESIQTVYVTATGKTSDHDWEDAATRIAADPKTHPGLNLIYDAREHKSVVSTRFVWGFATGLEPRAETVRWAVVSSRIVSKGMVHMLATLVQNKNILVRRFDTLEGAEAWIRGEGAEHSTTEQDRERSPTSP